MTVKTGRSAETPEHIKRAQGLRRGGLLYREIAELMGISEALAWRWVNGKPRSVRRRS